MIDPLLRNRISPYIFTPLARLLSFACNQPTVITLVALLFGLLASGTLLYSPVVAVVLLWCSGLFDVLDGEIARLHSKSSSAGAVLDIFSDRFVETAFVTALFLVNPTQNGLGAILILSSILLCVTSFLVVGIFSSNDSEKSFHYSPGLMERFEAFVFFSMMALMPGQFLLLSILFAGLTLATAFLRVYQFLCHVVKDGVDIV